MQDALTADNLFVGTPAFAAREVIRTKDPIGPPVDAYALGCLGYWLLTGETVFDATCVTDMLVAHLESTPEPPSQRTDIWAPAELDAIILRRLEKDPAEQFTDAAAIDRELGACALSRPRDRDQA